MAFLKNIGSSALLKSGGLGAIALAIATMSVPTTAMAQNGGWQGRQGQQGQAGNPGGGPRWNRGQSATSPQRVRTPRQIERRGEARAQRIDRRSENRAARVERQGDRAAARAAWQGNPERARRIDNRTERQARQVERRGDWRANQVDRNAERRAEAIREARRNRAEAQHNNRWRNGRSDDWQRNGSYRDNNRNRTYRANRDNNNWRNENNRNWRNDRNDYRRWSRTWRNDNRYDWKNYRARNRNIYRVNRYYAPYRNYSYRRVGIGFSLGSLFYGSNYWVSDPWQYRLPEVYGPYRWVRYYEDVLLVNTYTGEVVDVIYDFFW